MKQKISIAFLSLLGLFLALGQLNLSAQNTSPDDKEAVRKVKIVKVVNGETTVEERELQPGETFDWEGDLPEGHEGATIRKRIEVMGDEGEAKIIQIDGEGGSGEQMIFIADDMEGADGQEHVIIINGDEEKVHKHDGDHEMIIIKKKGEGEEDVEIKIITEDDAY